MITSHDPSGLTSGGDLSGNTLLHHFGLPALDGSGIYTASFQLVGAPVKGGLVGGIRGASGDSLAALVLLVAWVGSGESGKAENDRFWEEHVAGRCCCLSRGCGEVK